MDAEAYRTILSMAVEREIEAHSFYRSVADKVKDTSLKSLFAELAAEEIKHRETLEGFLAKPPSTLEFDASQDYKVAETLKLPDLTVDLKPVDGIAIAVKRELEAMQLYTQLANRSIDAGLKKTFTELASMERGHKARLEDLYTNMAFPEVW
jgi:rubrerythrin